MYRNIKLIVSRSRYTNACVPFSTHYLQITQNLESVRRVCTVRTQSSKLLPFPTKGRLKPIFRRPLATLPNKNSRCTSPNVARISKLPIFQQLLRSKPCPVSAHPTCSRPISPNAACGILSWAKFVLSAKLPQGVIGRRCAVRKTIGYG